MVSAVLLIALGASASAPGAEPDVGTSRSGLHYKREGAGPDLVLIHAFHTDLREWDEVAPVLVPERRVIRYDVRGHGRSAFNGPPPSSVADLLSLLDELKIARPTLAGLSMGSTIALDFALTHPDRVERLVLASPGIPGLQQTVNLEWMRPIGEAVRAGDVARAAELWWESPFLAGVRARGDAAKRHRTVILDNARIWTVSERPPGLDPPAGTRLSEVRVPVLVITGEKDDPGFDDGAKTLTAKLSRARHVVVPGAGHMISMEKPAELGRLILGE